jgi:hypothetical protein
MIERAGFDGESFLSIRVTSGSGASMLALAGSGAESVDLVILSVANAHLEAVVEQAIAANAGCNDLRQRLSRERSAAC